MRGAGSIPHTPSDHNFPLIPFDQLWGKPGLLGQPDMTLGGATDPGKTGRKQKLGGKVKLSGGHRTAASGPLERSCVCVNSHMNHAFWNSL